MAKDFVKGIDAGFNRIWENQAAMEAELTQLRADLATAREGLGWYADAEYSRAQANDAEGSAYEEGPSEVEEDRGARARSTLAKLGKPAEGTKLLSIGEDDWLIPVAVADAYAESEKLRAVYFKMAEDNGAACRAANEARGRMERAILWALGTSDFPSRKEGQGAYWWRTELQKRAGITGDQVNAAACLAALAPPAQPKDGLDVMIDKARDYKMTPDEKEAQRHSFAKGNVDIDRGPDARRTVAAAPAAAAVAPDAGRSVRMMVQALTSIAAPDPGKDGNGFYILRDGERQLVADWSLVQWRMDAAATALSTPSPQAGRDEAGEALAKAADNVNTKYIAGGTPENSLGVAIEEMAVALMAYRLTHPEPQP